MGFLILPEKIRTIEALNPKPSRHVLCFLETSMDPLTLCDGIDSRSPVPVCELFFQAIFLKRFKIISKLKWGCYCFGVR
jgi:hypothetical protein